MIDVWHKICLQNSIKFKFSPARGLTAPPHPQMDFVPTNQAGRTGYFMATTALHISDVMYSRHSS